MNDCYEILNLKFDVMTNCHVP